MRVAFASRPASADDASVAVRLLAIPASHPCAAVAAMLDAKRVEYERIDLLPALSRAWLRVTGFAGGTVPAVKFDGRRVQGSRAIARAIDERWPSPPLFPAGESARVKAEEIEAWGDGPLQEVARRLILWSLIRSPVAVRAALAGSRLQFRIPTRVAAALAPPVIRLDARLNRVGSELVRADLERLPGMIDLIDTWISSGDLGRDPPGAADYQVAASVRMLLCFEDLGGLLHQRPAAKLARRLIPSFPGHVPRGAFPADWLAADRPGATSLLVPPA